MIVVDDGSTDGTAELVEGRPKAAGATATLRLLRRAHRGKGAAVKAGMLVADGDYVARIPLVHRRVARRASPSAAT